MSSPLQKSNLLTPPETGFWRTIMPWLLLLCFSDGSALALENLRPLRTLEVTSQGLQVTLDFSHIQNSQWHELLSQPEQFYQAGYGLGNAAGQAALPQITELIPILSADQPQVLIQTITHREAFSTGLKKTPPQLLENDPATPAELYNWSTPGREQPLVSLGTVVSMRGRHYLPLSLSPLRLDPDHQGVLLPEQMILMLSGVQLADPLPTNEAGLIRSIFPTTDLYEQLGHYLIITPPLFEPYLQNLVDWKRRKGHPVTVVSTTNAGTTPGSIKAYIQDAYDSWENPPDYVLLIGDEDRGIGGFYVYNPDNEALVTDHPYVLLEGDDSFPEAWVGRLSVDTISELATVISKILHYERNPALSEPGWFKRALLVCTVSAAISPQHVNNWVGRKLTENGFSQIDTAYYPMQSSLSFVSNPINAGVGFVNYRGLGAWDHWIGPYFYNGDIDLLHNGYKLPILTSIVCGGGNFASSVDPVFGEKWLRAGTSGVPKGAVAFIGPSEVHTHTQFNNIIDVALYSAIFDQGVHELGPALWLAKLELWRNYYQSQYLPFGQSAEFYHNVYNILGDPGMTVWTDTPRSLMVDYPASLYASDDHVTVTVRDAGGSPIPQAFVFIQNADNARGLRTDASGRVTLPFTSSLESSLNLTITGANLEPFLETILLEDNPNSLSYSSFEVSPGGLLGAGGSYSLELSLTNHALDISNLILTLSSNAGPCHVTDSLLLVDHLASGASLNLDDVFELEIAPTARHGQVVELILTANTGNQVLEWRRSYPVQAPELVITDIILEAGPAQAGDSISFGLNLENQGGQACPPLTLTLLNQPLASSAMPLLECPALDPDETGVTENACLLQLSDQIFPGERLTLVFVSHQDGRQDTLSAILQVEMVQRFGPSTVDGYGYRVFDDRDVSFSMAPVYDWLEIDPVLGGAGVRLAISDHYEEDDETAFLELPFEMSYYGQIYAEITICSNGWLALGHSPELSFYNRVIPSPAGPNAMIAPFWDDLITEPGGVSYRVMEDQLILEWSNVSHLELASSLNFQVILYDLESHPTASGDNQIKMQFKDYHNYDTWMNFSTTGIESPDYSTGLQVAYNNLTDASVSDLEGGTALLFTTERGLRYPPSEMSLSSTQLQFALNPWSQAADSIAISNLGGSPLVYSIDPQDEPNREAAPDPLAGLTFVKGGPEVDGRAYSQSNRELFGYEWLDQDDPGGPVFDWQDISQPENELSYPGDPDDISFGPIQIGFDFPFYNSHYYQFFFSSNGSISFVENVHPWLNLTLPNGNAPAAMIAPWWDDLNNNDGIQGVPYFWSNGLDTAIVTWDNFPKFSTSDFHTFQMILTDRGDIILQYLEMEGTVTSSTVGIQNAARNQGVQVTFNAANEIGAGTAIRISRPLRWLSATGWSGRVEAGETGYFKVQVDTRDLGPSSFVLPLLLSSNSGNLSQAALTIQLDVALGNPPAGDLNSDYQINILDLTALVDFVIQLESPDAGQSQRGDLTGDGNLDVRDVVMLLGLMSL